LEKAATAEIAIANVLIKNPFPNIVTIFDVNNKYIELEHLDTTSKLDKTKLIEVMRLTKDFLQSLGIIYIDWKPDNIGISEDGIYKLFDFDASGLLDVNNNVWIVKPIEEYYSYRKAIENGITDPNEIDNYAFNKEIVNAKNYRFK